MYKKFSDKAKQVMYVANTHAIGMKHKYMGTHHVLLALVELGYLKGVQFDEVVREIDNLGLERSTKHYTFVPLTAILYDQVESINNDPSIKQVLPLDLCRFVMGYHLARPGEFRSSYSVEIYNKLTQSTWTYEPADKPKQPTEVNVTTNWRWGPDVDSNRVIKNEDITRVPVPDKRITGWIKSRAKTVLHYYVMEDGSVYIEREQRVDSP